MVHLIDAPGATADGLFTEGNPVTGVPYTWFGADWPNMVQNELVNVVEAAGLVPTKGNDSQLLSALHLLGNAVVADVINNGQFQVGERTGVSAGASVTVREWFGDRWVIDPGNAGTMTATSETDDVTATPNTTLHSELYGQPQRFYGSFPNLYRRLAQTVAATAGGSTPALQQQFYDVRILAGVEIVVSFYAACDTAIVVTPRWSQYFGGPGGLASPKTDTYGTPISIPGTGVWAHYSTTFTIPTVGGKITYDLAAARGNAAFRLELPLGQTFELDLWNVRCEPGKQARPFLLRTRAMDKAECGSIYSTSRSGIRGAGSYHQASEIVAVHDFGAGENDVWSLAVPHQFPMGIGVAGLNKLGGTTWYGSFDGSGTYSGAEDRIGIDYASNATVNNHNSNQGWIAGSPVLVSNQSGRKIVHGHFVTDLELGPFDVDGWA